MTRRRHCCVCRTSKVYDEVWLSGSCRVYCVDFPMPYPAVRSTPCSPLHGSDTVSNAALLQRQLVASLNVGMRTPRAPRVRKQAKQPLTKTKAPDLDLIPLPPINKVYFGRDHESWRIRWREFEDRGDCRCAICYDYLIHRPQVLLPCSHVFHSACYNALKGIQLSPKCPMCREEGDGKEGQWGDQLCRHNAGLIILHFSIKTLCRHGAAPLCAKILPQPERTEIGRRLGGATHHILEAHRALNDETEEVLRVSEAQSELLHRAECMLMARVRMGIDWDGIERSLKGKTRNDTIGCCPVCLEEFNFDKDDSVLLGRDFDPSGPPKWGQKSKTPIVLSCCLCLIHHSCLLALTRVTTDITDLCPLCRQGWVGRELRVVRRRWV